MRKQKALRNSTSATVSLRARGPLACFTRPELKVERVSYEVMTPSAARGLLEAVLWKPGMRWQVERIHVLAPIRYASFRRNEVATKAPRPSAALVNEGGIPPVYWADDNRAQRSTTALREVDYRIDARIQLTDKAGPEDNSVKFVEMFRRRVERGQHFHQPYFGCREFAAEVLPVLEDAHPIEESRDLGIMLWDIDYSSKKRSPVFFRAALENGILLVPATAEAADATLDSAGNAK